MSARGAALGVLALLGVACAPVGRSSSDAPEVPWTERIGAKRLARSAPPAEAAALWAGLRVRYPASIAAAREEQDALRAALAPNEFDARYAKAAQDRSTDPLAAYLLGRARIQDPVAAEAAFRRALELDPGFVWAVVGLAHLSRTRGDLFDAVLTYEEALERSPRSATLRRFLGELYLSMQLHVEADRELTTALRLEPDNPELLASWARAQYGLGRRDAALSALEEARRRTPDIPELHATLARLYLALDRPADAEAAWRRALELGEPEDVGMTTDLRIAHLLEGG